MDVVNRSCEQQVKEDWSLQNCQINQCVRADYELVRYMFTKYPK